MSNGFKIAFVANILATIFCFAFIFSDVKNVSPCVSSFVLGGAWMLLITEFFERKNGDGKHSGQ